MQQLNDMVSVAYGRVNLAICEATLAAMTAVTISPDTSGIVDRHNEACAEAYWELQSAEHHAGAAVEFGTEDEWNALSAEEQSSEWGRFHEKCAQGIGDEMYFYRVLMNMWLVGYVGH